MTSRKVLVADDEPLARERLNALVRRADPQADVREAADGEAALELLRAWKPDALFLDVQMPGFDGFEVLTELGPAAMPPTVFVTAYDEYALRAFDVAAVDYLLKPFDDERFDAAWQRLARAHALQVVERETFKLGTLLAHLREGNPMPPPPEPRRWADRLVSKRDGRTFIVRLADVQWVESAGNYVTLHAGREKHMIRETLSNLESRLDPSEFIRVHRRVIVSLDSIRELQPWFGGDQILIMKDGTKLRVSRNYREKVERRLAGLA